MSAVAHHCHHLACVDAAFALDDDLDSDVRSAANFSAAESGAAVRRSSPVLAQLDRLEALLGGWIAGNDAWRERTQMPLVRQLTPPVLLHSSAASAPFSPRDVADEDRYFSEVAQRLARQTQA